MKTQAQSGGQEMRVFAGNLVNPGFAQHDVVISIQEGKITGISSLAGRAPRAGDVDAREHTVVPGLIDIHCHGAVGEEFLLDCSQSTRQDRDWI